jgi:hypothetical protein
MEIATTELPLSALAQAEPVIVVRMARARSNTMQRAMTPERHH